ncbi:MAG TPA: potassium channel family protein [Verrucomicrobiae bacterium]
MSEPASLKKAARTLASDHPVRIGNFRSSVAQFLGALILMLIASPFLDELKYGPEIDVALATLVLVLGMLAVSHSRKTFGLGVALLIPAVVVRWLDHFQPHLLLLPVQNVTALLFMVFVEWQLLHFIFRTRHVNSEVLCAGISGYLLLGVLWMSAYMLVSRLNPVDLALVPPQLGAFAFNIAPAAAHPLSQFDAYYFSFITLSTVGYGDITPLSRGARTLAMLEAMTGTLYMALLISRLVALYSSQGSELVERKD